MKRFTRTSLLFALCLAVTIGCSTPRGRIKDSGEALGVDETRGGTAVYDEIMGDTLEKLLARHRGQVNIQNPAGFLVAFVGIDTKGAEDLRDHKPALYDKAEETMLNSGNYRMISMRFVDRAMQEASLRTADDLFIERNRTSFLANLSTEGLSPDYLMWGVMTTQSSKVSKKYREVRYRLSLEMIDSRSGLTVAKESGERVKEYKD